MKNSQDKMNKIIDNIKTYEKSNPDSPRNLDNVKYLMEENKKENRNRVIKKI